MHMPVLSHGHWSLLALQQVLHHRHIHRKHSIQFGKAPPTLLIHLTTPLNSHSKRPCMLFRALLRYFSRTRSSAFDNTHEPHHNPQLLVGRPISESQGPSVQTANYLPDPGTKSPQLPINCTDGAQDRNYLMPKRKAQDNTENMDTPAKKTKAAPKRGRKAAEEGESISFFLCVSIPMTILQVVVMRR